MDSFMGDAYPMADGLGVLIAVFAGLLLLIMIADVMQRDKRKNEGEE